MATEPHAPVFNQSVPFEDVDLLALDVPLREALEREGAGWAVERVREAGRTAASAEGAGGPGARGRRPSPGARSATSRAWSPTTASGIASTGSSSIRAGTGC